MSRLAKPRAIYPRSEYTGEHIDYALFGVLPAAIERDILIACAARTASPSPDTPQAGAVSAENLHLKYPPRTFTPSLHAEGWHLDINTKELRWESYVKAGYYVCFFVVYLSTVQS